MPRLLLGVLLLLLVSAPSAVRAQGDVVLYVGTEAVSLEEFEYYYKRVKGRTPQEYVSAFADYKLRVLAARREGLDTLAAFRIQLARLQGELLRPYLVDARKEERETRLVYGRARERVRTADWIRMAHISKYLPQNADRRTEAQARKQMDSVYAALQQGADFARLARSCSDDTGSRPDGGMLPWMPVNKHVKEWADKLAALDKDEVSAPFYSPLGIHIVKWVERKPCVSYEERLPALRDALDRRGADHPAVDRRELADTSLLYRRHPELRLRMRELHDGLLASCMARRHRHVEAACGEEELERFFNRRRSDYRWDLPRYKGAVVHCKDKKTAKAVRKYLKKLPPRQWKEALERVVASRPEPQARIEAGVFGIGQNAYVDKLVFKCGSFEPLPGLPYVFVMGKKLKKGPEDYRDVKERLIRDYQAVYGDAWMKGLRQKYKVEINQEVLKTVNNSGSN